MSNPQWKPLPPMMDGGGFSGAGGAGRPSFPPQQRPGMRQITKSQPQQSMFQNFPSNGYGGGDDSGGSNGYNQQSRNSGMPMSSGGGFSSRNNGYDSGSSGGGGTGGSAYGMGLSAANGPRGSPNNFSNSNGFGNGGGSSNNSSPFYNSSNQMRNGFSEFNQQNDSAPAANGYRMGQQMPPMNGHSGGNSGNGYGRHFDRSVSSSNFDSYRGGSESGYDRQMSTPNLRGGGGGASASGERMYGGDRMYGGGGGGANGGRSPPGSHMNMMPSTNTMPDMKIGMWNEGGSSRENNGQQNNMANFEIGTFNIASDTGGGGGRDGAHDYNSGGGGSHNYGTSQSGNNIQGGPGIRETGIIEKLLHSYGFIQCCDRQARLFFHFSQFGGNIEHLKIGDPVEFEMTYDRRTGKPIASLVSKIAPEVVTREERVIGLVTTEAKIDSETAQETNGRISYENRGECFFLPFSLSDVEGNVTVATGDKVSFLMATMPRSGNLVARTIRLENPAAPVKYQGQINSIKDNFGFIERADVVSEIFFQFSEMRDEGVVPQLGNDVEFTIQTRSGKEVACQIVILPPGTVVFTDVGTKYFKGQVLKPLDRSQSGSPTPPQPMASANGGTAEAPATTDAEALTGRVKYRGADRSEEEVMFGEKDQLGDFTLRHGDWVQFVIAVDRRDKMKRATKIELLDESFSVSDERREQGTIQSLKDSFGFIKCAERDARMFFRFSEILDVKRTLSVGDDVAFTVASDPNQPQRQLAIRIKHLNQGSVQFSVIVHKAVKGKVVQEPGVSTAWGNDSKSLTHEDAAAAKEAAAGKIVYELNNVQLEIPLHATDCDLRNFPRLGDQVQFDLNQSKATKETNAINVTILSRNKENTDDQSHQSPIKQPEETHVGYIAALKDGFGFLETLLHDKEIFFHFSNVEGRSDKLEVGMEVEYVVYNSREKGNKVSAENVKVVDKGTIVAPKAKEEVLSGKVVRPLRSINPDQDDYCGLVEVYGEDGEVLEKYEFGIVSLSSKKELLQEGDPVQFQASAEEPNFALNIRTTRQKQRAFVEAMKGQYGFLSYEVDEGKKLFFHVCEVESNEVLQQGDEVEFIVLTNKRGKHSACSVRKISSSKRPDRLISKLKTLNLEEAARGGKKVVVQRQPKGPEGGSRGFRVARNIVCAAAAAVAAVAGEGGG